MSPNPGVQLGSLRNALDQVADATVVLSYGSPGYWLRESSFDEGDTDVDLSGKVIVVTGGTRGLGRHICTALATRGARVMLLSRDRRRTEQACRDISAQTNNPDVEPLVADLSHLDEVRAAAATIRASTDHIDRLVLNAGVMLDDFEQTAAGVEKAFATNVLGGFLLTQELEDLLLAGAPSRVIHVTSGGMYTQRLDLEVLQGRVPSYDGVVAYAQTKRAQVILNEMWAERWAGRGVTSHAMHPGWADTPGVQRSLPRFRKMMRPFLRSTEQGADTAIWLCTAPDVDERSGLLWLDRTPRKTHLMKRTRATPEDRKALWDLCERLTKPTS